jgi:hypothetical protein
MRTMICLTFILLASCDADDDWNYGDPELGVTNTGAYPVRVEVDDLDDASFYVDPGRRVVKDLSSYAFDVRIYRTVDGLLLFDGDFDADDFDDDRVEITVTP